MPLAQRLLLLLTQLAWCLPFVVVTQCGASEGHTVMGWDLYDKPDEVMFWVGLPLLVAVVLAVKPWRLGTGIGSGAAGLGLRALAVGLCFAGSVLGPSLENLFGRVAPHLGWALQLGAWGLLGLGYLGGGVRALATGVDGPESSAEGRAGALLVVVAPLASAVVARAVGRNAWQSVLVAGLLVGPPLALAMLGVGRRVKAGESRTGWWRAAMVLLLAGWLVICVGTAVG